MAGGLFSTGCQQNSAAEGTAASFLIRPVSYKPAAVEPVLSVADEHARIAAHLQYTEDVLRHKGTRGMPSHLRRRRYRTLKLLHAYWTTGLFPIDTEHPARRRPCLMDRDGRVCAIGYLIEQTAGHELVEQLSQRHRNDRIETIKTPELLHWVQMSGLTMEECVMIQGLDR
ncbi:hypothetical protein B0919_17975 [Hymenobacter sp. CRA2]|nr:hypothetical protein B0919_17975 [Hymenobacter sp. CRA2]